MFAVTMRFWLRCQSCFSLWKFLAISSAIQKSASDCGCDAVVHLAGESNRPLTGGRCLPTSAWWPLETPLARFRVRKAVCELALRVCDSVWYYVMVLSCLQVVPALVSFERGRSGRTFSGVPAQFLNLECYCASGGGYLGGGASAPRYQGPLERLSREAGRPMGPSTPRCSSQSCAFVCLLSC